MYPIAHLTANYIPLFFLFFKCLPVKFNCQLKNVKSQKEYTFNSLLGFLPIYCLVILSCGVLSRKSLCSWSIISDNHKLPKFQSRKGYIAKTPGF